MSEIDFPLVTPAFAAAAWPESNGEPIYRLAVGRPDDARRPSAR